MLSDVTVILPAHNEAVSIGRLISSIRELNPNINICVGDNNCTDGTADIALHGGCNIIKVARQGKGHVVQELLKQATASRIIMADADNTYPVARCIVYIDLLLDNCDVVIGYRKWKSEEAMPAVNRLGNIALSAMAGMLFFIRKSRSDSSQRQLLGSFIWCTMKPLAKQVRDSMSCREMP